MATQEIPSGNGIKIASIARGNAYTKIAKKMEVESFLVDLF